MDGYRTLPTRCCTCGSRARDASYSVVRISAGEMESYHRFLDACHQTESVSRRSMPSSPPILSHLTPPPYIHTSAFRLFRDNHRNSSA
uniref:Uncharacterized protein n=1 Tax=Astyanax mexicanus TaxID=7994 RepID=A0A3B1JMN3_ASTMX